ncbi:hypothetical protein [Psychromonas sp. Urea-02u-13]|uniref:hypothetical protein n=1 Tax=Psychromonas sp. Urea-02u-13 TaxID=2058326 RepID=UPI000C3463A1|nr:hypothetical protein [Psychromonas sp. Urea-02u-13]PKG37118.1 hypothetical protein CXF74_20575 [Psychromonas sp. Urea-02u-13]
MKIKIYVGKKMTTLSWIFLENKISVRLPGFADAKYSNERNIIVASSNIGLIYIIGIDGEIKYEFSNAENENYKFYCLANTKYNDLGVNIIMAHDPELNGERFWQHTIDLENQAVGEPLTKWR